MRCGLLHSSCAHEVLAFPKSASMLQPFAQSISSLIIASSMATSIGGAARPGFTLAQAVRQCRLERQSTRSFADVAASTTNSLQGIDALSNGIARADGMPTWQAQLREKLRRPLHTSLSSIRQSRECASHPHIVAYTSRTEHKLKTNQSISVSDLSQEAVRESDQESRRRPDQIAGPNWPSDKII